MWRRPKSRSVHSNAMCSRPSARGLGQGRLRVAFRWKFHEEILDRDFADDESEIYVADLHLQALLCGEPRNRPLHGKGQSDPQCDE